MVRNTRIRCPKLPELKKFKNHTVSPPGAAFACKNHYRAPRAKNLGWYISILGFWPTTIRFHMVMHKKATTTLWFAKKPQVESVFFSFWVIWGHFTVILRSFCGHFGLNLFNLLILGFFQEI